MNNWLLIFILSIVVDYGVYLTADKECRRSNGVYLIPVVGGWAAAIQCNSGSR